MLFLLILGHFWCSLITSVTLSSNLCKNFKKIPPKNSQKIQKYPTISKNPKIKKKSKNPKIIIEKKRKKISKTSKLFLKSPKSKNLKKSQKLPTNHFLFKHFFFSKYFFCKKKKLLFSQFCQLVRLVFDQSSPLHPVSDFRGGSLSVTQEEQEHNGTLPF